MSSLPPPSSEPIPPSSTCSDTTAIASSKGRSKGEEGKVEIELEDLDLDAKERLDVEDEAAEEMKECEKKPW